jgi:opacity protein-like surface antigen
MYGWTKGSLKNENGENVAVKDFTVNNFDIPVLAGVGMDLGLFNARVQAGPVVKFNSSETLENTGAVDWKDVTYTWAAGVGIDLFNFIMIDARMIGGWKEGMEPTNFGEIFNFDNVNKETNTWTLSIGVMF